MCVSAPITLIKARSPGAFISFKKSWNALYGPQGALYGPLTRFRHIYITYFILQYFG